MTDTTGSSEEAIYFEMPERVGSYRLWQRLGEGGVRLVYEAEFDDEERVALLQDDSGY